MRKKRTKSKGVLSYKKKRTKTKAFSKKKRISKSNSQKKISRSKMKKTQTKKRIRSKRNKTNKRSKKKKRNVLVGGAPDAETAKIEALQATRKATRDAAAAAVEGQDILPGQPGQSENPVAPPGGPSRPQSTTESVPPLEPDPLEPEPEPFAEPVTPVVDEGTEPKPEPELEPEPGATGLEPEPESEPESTPFEKELDEVRPSAEPEPEPVLEAELEKVRELPSPPRAGTPPRAASPPGTPSASPPSNTQVTSDKAKAQANEIMTRAAKHSIAPRPSNESRIKAIQKRKELADDKQRSVDELKNTLTELSNEYINEQYQIIEDDSLNRPDKKDKLQEHNKAFINDWINTVDSPSMGVSGVRFESNSSFREWEKGEWNKFQEGLREKEAIIKGQIAQLEAATASGRRNWTLHSKKREEGGRLRRGLIGSRSGGSRGRRQRIPRRRRRSGRSGRMRSG